MQGKIESVEKKQTKTGKDLYTVTINGTKGSSFAVQFADNIGKVVEYESEINGTYTNFKFVKVLEGNASQQIPTQQQAVSPKPVTAGEIKLLFIPKALECAINAAKLTCKDGTITSEQIMKVAKVYLTWMINEGLGEEANG